MAYSRRVSIAYKLNMATILTFSEAGCRGPAMVLIAAAVCNKTGKAIISRQFVELTKSRIEVCEKLPTNKVLMPPKPRA